MAIDGVDGAGQTVFGYVEGQRLYLATCDPAARASIVIDNTGLAHPVVVSRP